MNGFDVLLRETEQWPLCSDSLTTLQVNLGYRCNQACHHCHVNAGPQRTEMMSRAHVEMILAILRNSPILTLDLTGGAPELHPDFEYIIREAREAGCRVICRSNLTVLLEPGLAHLISFLSAYRVQIVASLPYFLEANVDRQRGAGVFARSIEAIRQLNVAGYGHEDDYLDLSLVYNPGGAFLPGSQAELEIQFRSELQGRYGVTFNRLFAMANMPVGRFEDFLRRSGNEEQYWERLRSNFNERSVPALMCKSLLSVSWDGLLYDCDFNQMIGLGLNAGLPARIEDFDYSRLSSRPIATAEHCLGCTAGQGSSCGGALA